MSTKMDPINPKVLTLIEALRARCKPAPEKIYTNPHRCAVQQLYDKKHPKAKREAQLCRMMQDFADALLDAYPPTARLRYEFKRTGTERSDQEWLLSLAAYLVEK